jgi:GGDEF domain-containing protein
MRFGRSLPTGAVIARLGGDEFGVLINGDYGFLKLFALQATLSYPINCRGNVISISVSIGHVERWHW